jgi:hypothetical protein
MIFEATLDRKFGIGLQQGIGDQFWSASKPQVLEPSF